MNQPRRFLSLLALCSIVLMTAACQRGQVNSQATNAEAARIPVDTSITLERRPDFFSSCPFYKLTISADGTVRIEPRAYNKYRNGVIPGNVITSRISQEQLKQLISEFEKIDFYSLTNTFDDPSKNNQNDCPNFLFDSSSTVTSITLNSKSKEVQHYHGCSGTQALSGLANLENKIDEVVNIKKWFDCEHGENRINLSNQPDQK